MLTSTTIPATLQTNSALPTRLGRDELIRAFRVMYLSRRIDDREILFKAAEQDLLPDQRRRA